MFTPTLYFDAKGTIVRAILTEASLVFNSPPVEAAGPPLTFDATTNAGLVADLLTSTDPYRLVEGVLTKGGEPVTITPPPVDQLAADRATVLQAFATIVPDPAAQEALARILEGPG
jgi:hypothetical protein